VVSGTGPGFPGYILVDVHALGDAPCFGRLADRALLPGFVTRMIVPVGHLVTILFPALFQGEAERLEERPVRLKNPVISSIHDHDVFLGVVENQR